MRSRTIYLDNSTTTRPSEKAISSMMPFLTDMWGHPSAPHKKGQQLHPALVQSYKTLYDFLGAKDADTFLFTSSGAEAINHVIHSVYRDVTLPSGKNQFISSSLDEAPAIMAINQLEAFSCVGKSVKTNSDGIITADTLSDAISPRTALVSLSWANGLTGVIQPLAEISALCKQRSILLHLDATHVLGKLFIDIKDSGADFITLNGDNLHAPKGTGGLYIREGVKCSPFIVGGNEQGGMRAGILNIPGLAGLAAAAHESLESRDYLCTEIARLRDKLEDGILKQIPETYVFFKDQERLPNCTAIAFPGIVNEALLFSLDRKGVCASIGGNHFQQLGIQLTATGVDEVTAHSAISFSLSRYTTEEEIDHAIERTVECAQELLKISNQIFKK